MRMENWRKEGMGEEWRGKTHQNDGLTSNFDFKYEQMIKLVYRYALLSLDGVFSWLPDSPVTQPGVKPVDVGDTSPSCAGGTCLWTAHTYKSSFIGVRWTCLWSGAFWVIAQSGLKSYSGNLAWKRMLGESCGSVIRSLICQMCVVVTAIWRINQDEAKLLTTSVFHSYKTNSCCLFKVIHGWIERNHNWSTNESVCSDQSVTVVWCWFQGKVKSMYENMKNLQDPTPRFDSHISKNASKVTSLTSYRAFELTQVRTLTHRNHEWIRISGPFIPGLEHVILWQWRISLYLL